MTLALAALLGLTTIFATAASGGGTTLTLYVSATPTSHPYYNSLDAALAYATGTSVTADSVEIILRSNTTFATACSVTRNITIKSESGPYTVTTTAAFTVGSGYSLTLENANFTRSGTDTANFISVTNGQLYLENGATLTRNRLYIDGINSFFTMNGGIITGNTASYGGGVCIHNNATFTMNNGTISNNTATNRTIYGYSGGGVLVATGGAFTMNGGTIIGNTAYTYGGGLQVSDSGSSFTMNDGEISDNHNGIQTTTAGVAVNVAKESTFDMHGGKITGNSGFSSTVIVWNDSVFNMYDGEISGNRAPQGGGVFVGSGSTFNLSGTPVVKNNTSNGTTLNNVYRAGTLTVTGPLTEGAEVWINYPNAKDTIFATATTAADAANGVSYFRNDADSTLLAGARDTSIIWGLVVAQIWDGSSKTSRDYPTLKAAIAAYTDSTIQVIQLLENIAETATVNKDLYLNLSGKTISGALTVNDGCTLYGLDSTSDDYKGTGTGKITNVASGSNNIAQYTDTKAAHTTKAKHYITVTEDNRISFHWYNVQVYDYYFRLAFDENNDSDTGSAMMNFSTSVQGDSRVADAITKLELSSALTSGGSEKKPLNWRPTSPA